MSLIENTEIMTLDLETIELHPAFWRIIEFSALRFREDGTRVANVASDQLNQASIDLP